MAKENGFSIGSDDVNKSKIEMILQTPNIFSHYELESHFYKLSKEFKESGDLHSWRVSYLLYAIFTFSFSKSGGIVGFEPKAILYPNRSYRPSDVNEQFESALNAIAKISNNHFVNARIYDILWSNNRRDANSAKYAINAYAKLIDEATVQLAKLKNDNGLPLFDVVDLLERAITISAMVNGRKKELDEVITTSAISLYKELVSLNIFSGFYRLTHTLFFYDLYNTMDLAFNAESIADIYINESFFDAVKQLFSLGALLYERAGDSDSSKRCKLKSAEITLSQTNYSQSASLKAHWFRQSIGEFRSIGGMEEKIKHIRNELESIRDAINDDLHLFSVSSDLTDVVEETYNIYEELNFSDVLKVLIQRFKCPSIEKIIEQAKVDVKQFAFLSMSSQNIFDDKGRVIAVVPALNTYGEIPKETAILNFLRNYHLEHLIYVCGEFEIVRKQVVRFTVLNENSFDAITHQSPFVPPGYVEIFSKGFYKLWQGDYISACYILIPQLENSIRWVLESRNMETTKIDPRLLEEATSITQMLNNFKEELESIFGEDIVLTMDLLFNKKGGPALRHQLAHGRLTSNHCNSSTSIFACCFIFYLTGLPLYRVWNEAIGPHIRFR